MAIIYVNIADEMNKRKYPVFVSEQYEPAGLPTYYTKYMVEPIYQPMDNDKCLSMLSPMEIVDACFQDAELEFENDRDRLAVIQTYELYIDSIQRYSIRGDSVTELLDRIRTALTTLRNVEERVHHFKQKTGQVLKPQKSIFDLLSEVL